MGRLTSVVVAEGGSSQSGVLLLGEDQRSPLPEISVDFLQPVCVAYIEGLVGDSVNDIRSLSHEDRSHRSDKVLRAPGKVPKVSVDLGFNVEQDRLVSRTFYKVEHFLEGRDLGPGVDL